MMAEGWHTPRPFFSGDASPSLFACIWKNCVASRREGDNPFVYPELHHRLCQAQQMSRQSHDGPTNLTAPAHHEAKSAHHIKAARERRPREADAKALLCHFAGVFIVPLTCCTPGTFRGSIQVAKMGKRVGRLPHGWAATFLGDERVPLREDAADWLNRSVLVSFTLKWRWTLFFPDFILRYDVISLWHFQV